jgi:ABC-2 type transport system ATP-binding protein
LNNVIETKELTKLYGKVRAVDHLNLSVDEGEIFGLLGPNGAGKTTTIILLMGLSVPTSGTATVLGYDIVRESKELRKSVGLLPEFGGFYEDLTAVKNLEYIGSLNDLSKTESQERAKSLLTEVGLTDWRNEKVEKYSRGMKQRLGIASALLKNPKMVIFDEPTIGLDPAGTKEVRDLILKLNKEQGLTVFLSSHLLHEIQLTCSNVGIINHGKLIVKDSIQNLTKTLSKNEGLSIEFKLHNINPSLIKEIELLEGITKVVHEDDKLNVYMKNDVTIQVSQTITRNGAEILMMKPREYSMEEIFMKYYKEA